MKSLLTTAMVLFCATVFAQEHIPIQLNLTAIVLSTTNAQMRYNGSEKDSFTIKLNDHGKYEEIKSKGPGTIPEKEFGTYTLNGNVLTLTTSKGVVRNDNIQQMDQYITKITEGDRILYFVRTPDL
jgi:hypothetical protein